MNIQFDERIGHLGRLTGPKLFRPEAYLACTSSKLCEFIVFAYVIYFERVMSPHHSHEMSQRSHVYRTSLYL